MENNYLQKYSGQVFTPDFIVESMLDLCGYNTFDILQKHIIDNSCGDGAFLCLAVERYCKVFLNNSNDKDLLKFELETYFHGIELDNVAYTNCLFNLNEIVKHFEIHGVIWDIINADALTIDTYDYKMDYVVGNPPYVRVHNLEDSYKVVKSFYFANGGMTDLYLVFFELGFRMMNNNGKMCYITPSSWLSSLAATNMRNYLFENRKLACLIDLEHFQAFDGATTYTLISYFDNTISGNKIEYYTYNEIKKEKKFVDILTYDEIKIGKDFYISKKSYLDLLKKIKQSYVVKQCTVKNGFATLNDNVFIGNLPFNIFTIPVLKASTGKWTNGFFPYDVNGKPLPKETIFNEKTVCDYLNYKKEYLLKGKDENLTKDWYLYGRSQALKDVFTDKIAINTIIKDINSIKLNVVPAGSGLYSGLYILTTVPFSIIESVIKSDSFINYIKTLKKYKSGGYYTFNSKDLEHYLNFKLSENVDTSNFVSSDERRVSQGYLKFL